MRFPLPSFLKKAETPAVMQKSAGTLSPYALYMGMSGNVYLYENMTTYEIVRNYKRIAPLNAGITKIADSVGSLPFIIENSETGEKITKHPLLRLLNSPNSMRQRTKRDFFRDLTIWKILEGDAYPLATGNVNREPLELYILNPQSVTIQPNGTTGEPASYTYNSTAGAEIYNHVSKGNRFINEAGNRELWHIANFNPDAGVNDCLDGMSQIQPLYYEINQYLQASRHNLSLLKNGARASGAFVLKTKDGMPAVLDDATFNRLKMSIEENYAGANNAGRPLVLEGGLEFQEMSMSPKDLDFKALKDAAEEAIYKVLGIPVPMIMTVKTTANNFSNLRMEFYESTILPFADDLCDHLTAFLFPRYKDLNLDEQKLVIDRDRMDILAAYRTDRRKLIEGSLIMTTNEKRKEFKLDKIKNGDNIVDPNGRYIAGPDKPPEAIPAVPNDKTPPANSAGAK